MPQNLELKARCSSLREAAACARRLGARDEGILRQTDTYFAFPCGRLKLREGGAKAELIKYERSDIKGNRFSQYSITPVRNAKSAKSLLSSVFGRRVVVRKQRRLYRMTDVRIHLDTVADLGSFIEFEVLVSGGRRRAERLMKVLWRAFRIRKNSLVSGSYSDLLLKKRKSK